MTKLNEIKPSIFAELEKIAPDNNLFVVFGTGEELDNIYLYEYGERMTNDDLNSIKTAQYIKTIYLDRWDKAFELFSASDKTLPNIGSQETETTTHKLQYTDTITDTDIVPSFDSTENNIDRLNDRTLTHNEVTDGNINERVRIKDKQSLYNFNTSFEYLRKNYLNDIVFHDVNTLITMYIHN